MEEAFLKKLYEYAEVITALRQMVSYWRVGDSHHASAMLEDYEERIRNTCADCAESDWGEAVALWELVTHIYTKERDNTVRADVVENAIAPMLEQWVQSLGNIALQLDEEYVLESTACGYLTIKNLRIDKYYHSNNNPMEEARRQVEHQYVPSVEEYAVLGCGLGYQVYQIYQISKGSVKIYLYEQEMRMIEYARKYGVLSLIPEEKLEICTSDAVYSFLLKVDSESVGAFMNLPAIWALTNETDRNAMLQAYGEYHTPLTFKNDFRLNFWRNIHSGARVMNGLSKEDLTEGTIREEVVVVAAGPSLDDCMEQIRGCQGKKTIIAVGTVFSKLMKQGIRPDFVVVSDPQKRTLQQLEEYWEETVPLVLDTASYWEFARKYQGPKYLVLTPQCEDIVRYALQEGIRMWPSGGTVMSLAVEVAVKFQAKKIWLAGVDLAYPGGISHASDTMDRHCENKKNLIPIPGVNGQTVYSTTLFGIYRQYLEGHIEKYPQITWYNMSARGARIAGTIEVGSSEEIHQ